jgi:poly(3-hydroxybutyrate) depolymerase
MLSLRSAVPLASLLSLSALVGCGSSGAPDSTSDAASGAPSTGAHGGPGTLGSTDAGMPVTPGSMGSMSSGSTSVDGGSTTPASAMLHVDLSQTSVSGLSSGAFMAVQFHVAFSSIMKGAAIFAGGPFYCAQASETTATTTCMSSTTAPSIAPYVAITKQYASSGDIDDPTNLASQKVFLFGGADDHTVDPVVMDALDSYYATYMSAGSIQYVSRRTGTSHTMPTVAYGTSCDESISPYIGSCNYDGAGIALAQIYGTLAPAATTLSGSIVTISQSQFLANASSHSVADDAYAYLPASCANGETCRVHVAFHGCEQNEAAVGSDFYEHAGYNAWADTNHIIVLYPQTTTGGTNFEGCWDWYGYDSASYATKTGPQMAMVRAMIDFLVSGGPIGTGAASSDAGSGGATLAGFDAGAFTLPSLDAGLGSLSSCVTDSNTDHVLFGRAHVTGSSVLADGSNDNLGADSAVVWTSLKETSTGTYALVSTCL